MSTVLACGVLAYGIRAAHTRTTGDTLEGVLVIGAVPFEVFDAKIKELLAPAGKTVK